MWEVEIHKHVDKYFNAVITNQVEYSWIAIDLINGNERERVANWLQHEGEDAFKKAIIEARREARRRNEEKYVGPDDWEIREMHSYLLQDQFPWFVRFFIEKQDQRIEVGTASLDKKGDLAVMRSKAQAELERIKLAEQIKPGSNKQAKRI